MNTIIRPNAEQAQRLQILADWDLSQVRDLAIREGVAADKVDRAIAEYRKFIGLHIFDAHRHFVMSAPVDPIWHCHILCTRDYAEFCQKVLGSFLHHRPTRNEEERRVLGEAYREGTRSVMRQIFGGIDEEWWGSDAQICMDPCTNGEVPIDELMEYSDERVGPHPML